jgi:exodeoxyribonuclease VII large subunit
MDLLETLFEQVGTRALTVSELSSQIKDVLELGFASVWVEGEITNFHAAASGHWYFSLTDGGAALRAACFRGQNGRIRFHPSDGQHVRCRGRLSVYEKRGEYQLLVESLEPVGAGALTAAFEQVKARLLAEGLFNEELKRPIPPFPRRVGIVTSPTGAAVKDILSVLQRRARSVNVVIIPTLVQGENAGEQIARAIALANEYCDGCLEDGLIDVLIVGRGGGSAEDLWAFNEERVARAIRNSRIPVISAVGHEVDFTIADMAADLRAPTPSAAAEIVAQSEVEVLERIAKLSEGLERRINYLMLSTHADLQSLELSPVFTEFPSRIRELGYMVDDLTGDAEAAVGALLERRTGEYRDVSCRLSPRKISAAIAGASERLLDQRHRAGCAMTDINSRRRNDLETAMAGLNALSPLAVLGRGYSVTQKSDGEIVRNAHQTDVGESLTITLAQGKIEAEVTGRHAE